MPTRHCVLPPGLARVTREFIVAEGRFAPGHLGELTQVIPFDLVDAVLDETRCVQRRLRDLPSRVGVYFLLAMCLFPELGYRLVWHKLTAALTGVGIEVAEPTAKALRDLRRRLCAEPMKRVFETLAGPLAQPVTPPCSGPPLAAGAHPRKASRGPAARSERLIMSPRRSVDTPAPSRGSRARRSPPAAIGQSSPRPSAVPRAMGRAAELRPPPCLRLRTACVTAQRLRLPGCLCRGCGEAGALRNGSADVRRAHLADTS